MQFLSDHAQFALCCFIVVQFDQEGDKKEGAQAK